MKFFGFLLGSSMGAVKPICKQVCTGTANNWTNYNGGTKGITQTGKICFSDFHGDKISINLVDISHCGCLLYTSPSPRDRG